MHSRRRERDTLIRKFSSSPVTATANCFMNNSIIYSRSMAFKASQFLFHGSGVPPASKCLSHQVKSSFRNEKCYRVFSGSPTQLLHSKSRLWTLQVFPSFWAQLFFPENDKISKNDMLNSFDFSTKIPQRRVSRLQ